MPTPVKSIAPLAAVLFCALHAVPGTGQTITMPSSLKTECPSDDVIGGCEYELSTGQQITVSGSGFGSATSVQLQTIGGDSTVADTINCPASGGNFSCTWMATELTNSQGSPPEHLVATGSPGGATASVNLDIGAGVAIVPTSGPPGTVVRVYGSGYLGKLKFVADTAVAITFGTQTAGIINGTGPAVVYNNDPGNSTCVPSGGDLGDNGPCTFVVPGYPPGVYNVGVWAGLLWGTPDIFACGQPWCVETFTITPPAVTAVIPAEITPGFIVSVAGSGFASIDTMASVNIDGVIVSPSGGCPFSPTIQGTILCTAVVPASASAPGPHSITITGLQYGDYASGQFVVPGSYPLTLPQEAVPGATLTVSGLAFDPRDTSVSILVGPVDLTPAGGCPLTYGAFSCQITIPPATFASVYNVQVTGNVVKDLDDGTLTVVPSLSLSPSSAAVGATVAISGAGFGSAATKVSATLNGEPLQLTLQTPDIQTAGGTIPGEKITGTSCPAENSAFPEGGLPGFICTFTVPMAANPVSNQVVVTDDSGHSASATLTLAPSLIFSPAQAPTGAKVSVTGYGFPSIQGSGYSFLLGPNANPETCTTSSGGVLSCSLTVPDVAPGTYTFQVDLASVATVNIAASAPFTVVPAITGPDQGSAGTSITLNADGFPAADTAITLLLNTTTVISNGCTLARSTPSANFICRLNVPDLPAGLYVLKAVGNSSGATAIGSFTISGISISPFFGQVNTGIDVKGYGFSNNDSVISFSLAGVAATTLFDDVNQRDGCSATGGTFQCRVDSPVTPGGPQPLIATGNSGDNATATFSVGPFATIFQPATFPAQGPAGTQLTIGGDGFLAADNSVVFSINGTTLASCSASAGSFFCPAFTMPAMAPGSYTIAAAGVSGAPGDVVPLTFQVTPGMSLSITQGMVGQTVAVTGNNFLASDTSATVYFELGQPINPGGSALVVTCPVVNSALSSCSFKVPAMISSGEVTPGGNYSVVITGSSGDQGFVAFTVNAVALVVSPVAAQIGSTVAVSGGGFSLSDTTATLNFSGAAVGASAGCAVVNGSLSPCQFVVPFQIPGAAVVDSSRTGINYTITATGNTSDQLTVSFSAQATFTISTQTLTQGANITVSGAGFPCNGSGSAPCADMPLGAEDAVSGNSLFVTPSNCPINAANGQFSCSVTLTGTTGNPPAVGNYFMTEELAPVVNLPFTVVAPVPTILSLSSSALPILGQFNSLTATIFPAAATGTVIFYDGVTPLGTASISGGQATLKMAPLGFGPHSLKAVYPEVAPYGTSLAPLYETIGAVSSSSFGSASTFATSGQPNLLAQGDFNGDGVIDLAVTNGTSGIGILIGNGDGTFKPEVNYSSGGSSIPLGIAIADLNGDGVPDLAVANGTGNNITMLIGNGDGTFQAATQLATGTEPFGIVAGDFNGDGILDLAFTNHLSNTIAVLLGKGGGTFQTPVLYSVISTPDSIVVTDLNGDGIPDLVVASLATSGNSVGVLLGMGNGIFQPHVDYPAGALPSSIAVGDFNGDGNVDLAVVNSSGIDVLLGNGDGSLKTAVPYAGDSPQTVSVGDIDGDGFADLVTANVDGTVSLFLGNGNGTFLTPISTAVSHKSLSLVVADFNGDGRSDIAVANQIAGNIAILTGEATAPTTSVLSQVSPSGDTYGQPFTATLTVTGSGFRPATPTGAATLLDGGQIVATSSQTSSPYTLTTTTLGGGRQTLTGSYGGDSQNAPSVSSGLSISVGETPQTITFNQPPAHVYGDASFTPNATASSGLTVTFTSSSPAVCSVTNSTVVTITGVGVCSLTAIQNGNADYLQAASVTQTFSVAQQANAIVFNQPSAHTYGDAPFTLSPSASSGLTVTLTSNSIAVCTVAVTTVTILHAGTCSLTASQAGNATILAATAVTQTFTVNQATPVLTWPAPADISYGTALGSAQLNATANIPGAFVYSPAAGTVLLVGNGRPLTVTFTPTDATDYSVSSASTTINVNPAPQYTLNVAVTPANGGAITATIGGQPFSCSSTCSSVGANSTSTLTLTAVPAAGYTFTSWTSCPSASGTSCTVTLTGTITVAAVFTGSNNLTYTQGALVQNRATGLYSRSVTVTNSGPAIAASAYVADGLPAGVSLVNASGLTSATVPAGSPYIELGAIGANSSITTTVEFSRTATQAIAYTTRILGPGPR